MEICWIKELRLKVILNDEIDDILLKDIYMFL